MHTSAHAKQTWIVYSLIEFSHTAIAHFAMLGSQWLLDLSSQCQPIIHLAVLDLEPTKQVKQKCLTSSMCSSANSSTALCCFSLDRSFLINPGSAATALKNANMAVKKVVKNIRLVNNKCEVAIRLDQLLLFYTHSRDSNLHGTSTNIQVTTTQNAEDWNILEK